MDQLFFPKYFETSRDSGQNCMFPTLLEICVSKPDLMECSHFLESVHLRAKEGGCNVCTPQVELTPRNLEAGSAYRLSPQSPVSKEARIKGSKLP